MGILPETASASLRPLPKPAYAVFGPLPLTYVAEGGHRFPEEHRTPPKRLFYVEQLTPEIDEEDGDVGRGDTGDAGGLGDGFGLVAL